jgi:hypothetical protein
MSNYSDQDIHTSTSVHLKSDSFISGSRSKLADRGGMIRFGSACGGIDMYFGDTDRDAFTVLPALRAEVEILPADLNAVVKAA